MAEHMTTLSTTLPVVPEAEEPFATPTPSDADPVPKGPIGPLATAGAVPVSERRNTTPPPTWRKPWWKQQFEQRQTSRPEQDPSSKPGQGAPKKPEQAASKPTHTNTNSSSNLYDEMSSVNGEEEGLRPEEVQKIKAKTMYNMVDEIEDAGAVPAKLLFLTNLQADQLASSNDCLQRMMDVLELPEPKLLINLITSHGFRPWTTSRHKFSRRDKKRQNLELAAAFTGVTRGRPPFVSVADEDNEEALIDTFMKDVILPLAAKTNAIILCAGTKGDCVLSDSLTRVFSIYRSRWSTRPPFSVVHATPQIKDLYCNPDEKANWCSIRDRSRTWRLRQPKLLQALEKIVPPLNPSHEQHNAPHHHRTTDLHRNIMCMIIVDSIDRSTLGKGERLDLAPFNRLINELVRHLSATRPSVALKTGFTNKDKLEDLFISPAGLGVTVATLQNGTPTIFLGRAELKAVRAARATLVLADTRPRPPLPRLCPFDEGDGVHADARRRVRENEIKPSEVQQLRFSIDMGQTPGSRSASPGDPESPMVAMHRGTATSEAGSPGSLGRSLKRRSSSFFSIDDSHPAPARFFYEEYTEACAQRDAYAEKEAKTHVLEQHDAYCQAIARASFAWGQLVELQEAVRWETKMHTGAGRWYGAADDDDEGQEMSTEEMRAAHNAQLRSFTLDAHRAQRAVLIEFAKLELITWFETLLKEQLNETLDCMSIAYLREAMTVPVSLMRRDLKRRGAGSAVGKVMLWEAIEQAGSDNSHDTSGKQLDAMGAATRLLPATPEQAHEAASWLADRIFFYAYQLLKPEEREKADPDEVDGGLGGYKGIFQGRVQAAASLTSVCLTSPHMHAVNLQPEHSAAVNQLVLQLVRLDRLPKETSYEGLLMLRDAWREYDVAMHLAESYKLVAKALFAVQLIVAWSIVVLSTMGSSVFHRAMPVTVPLPWVLNSSESPSELVTTWPILLGEGAFALSVVTSVLLSVEGIVNAKNRWRQLRGGALSLQSLIWCYRTRVGPFQLDVRRWGVKLTIDAHNPDSEKPERALCQALMVWRRELVSSGDLSLSAFGRKYPRSVYTHFQDPPVEAGDTRTAFRYMRAAHRSADERYGKPLRGWEKCWAWITCCCHAPKRTPLEEDYHSPVKPALYIQRRIQVAIAFYQSRIPLYARSRYVLKSVLILTAVSTTVLARYRYESFVAIVTAFGAAVTSWGEFGDSESKVSRYTRAVFALTNLLSWWNSLSEVEKASTANIAQLIVSAERTISEEALGWMAAAQHGKADEVEQQRKRDDTNALGREQDGKSNASQGPNSRAAAESNSLAMV